MPIPCPNCGTAVADGRTFCLACGHYLGGTAPPGAAPQPNVVAPSDPAAVNLAAPTVGFGAPGSAAQYPHPAQAPPPPSPQQAAYPQQVPQQQQQQAYPQQVPQQQQAAYPQQAAPQQAAPQQAAPQQQRHGPAATQAGTAAAVMASGTAEQRSQLAQAQRASQTMQERSAAPITPPVATAPPLAAPPLAAAPMADVGSAATMFAADVQQPHPLATKVSSPPYDPRSAPIPGAPGTALDSGSTRAADPPQSYFDNGTPANGVHAPGPVVVTRSEPGMPSPASALGPRATSPSAQTIMEHDSPRPPSPPAPASSAPVAGRPARPTVGELARIVLCTADLSVAYDHIDVLATRAAAEIDPTGSGDSEARAFEGAFSALKRRLRHAAVEAGGDAVIHLRFEKEHQSKGDRGGRWVVYGYGTVVKRR